MTSLSKVHFNTDINIVGSIPSYDFISKVIQMKASDETDEQILDKVVNQNIFAIRTKDSRTRFLSATKKNFLSFKTIEEKELIFSIINSSESKQVENMLIYILLSLNNKLFMNVTRNIFRKKLLNGGIYFLRQDVEDYLFELAKENESLKSLPEITIRTISSKYLTIMTKLGFLEGKQKKSFVHRIPDMKAMLFSVALLESIKVPSDKIYSHELMDMWLIEDPLKEELLKNAAIKNMIEYTSTGKNVKIHCNLSWEELVNVITE